MAHDIVTNADNNSVQELLKNDSTFFMLIFSASFVVFLVVALGASLLTWQWRSWLPGAEGETSLIGGVKSAVYTFMSYLT
jgi:light-harvesting complex 1 beta chain